MRSSWHGKARTRRSSNGGNRCPNESGSRSSNCSGTSAKSFWPTMSTNTDKTRSSVPIRSSPGLAALRHARRGHEAQRDRHGPPPPADPQGLRTLSPRNPLYEGRCVGDQPTRDRAYHQGTVWPWLLEHYVKACFDMHGKAFLPEARDMLKNFEEDISVSGIASINEIYDGDPPHNPRGAVSQAWSVGAILRIAQMIEAYEIKK